MDNPEEAEVSDAGRCSLLHQSKSAANPRGEEFLPAARRGRPPEKNQLTENGGEDPGLI